jgi:hypothetical protein
MMKILPRKVVEQSCRKVISNSHRGFLAAGGLTLSVGGWSRPQLRSMFLKAKSAPGATGTRAAQHIFTAEQKPASIGPLLLPLLAFLSNISFDRQLVTQSKINKEVS